LKRLFFLRYLLISFSFLTLLAFLPVKLFANQAQQNTFVLTAQEKQLKAEDRLVLVAQKLFALKKKQVQINNQTVYLDCSGFVRAVYLVALNKDLFQEALNMGIYKKLKSSGFQGSQGALAMYVYFKSLNKIRPFPKKGDVVFFDNTYDKNKNNKWDDLLTHVGIITHIHPDGTLTFIHAGTSKGISQDVLNLRYANKVFLNKKKINSHLQRPLKGQKKPYKLTGELARAFGGF